VLDGGLDRVRDDGADPVILAAKVRSTRKSSLIMARLTPRASAADQSGEPSSHTSALSG
jgi:hypothetical protein